MKSCSPQSLVSLPFLPCYTANHGLHKFLCAFLQLPKAKSKYTDPHWRLLAVPFSHTPLVRPPHAIIPKKQCSVSACWALSELPPQEIHWCTSQTLHTCASVLLVSVCRRKYLTEVSPISELAPHHSTDTAHPQHKAAPQLLVSSSSPFARAGEMEEK